MLHATIVGSARRRQLRRNASASSGCETSLIASGVASTTWSGSMSSSSASRRASAIGAVPMPTIAITTPVVRGQHRRRRQLREPLAQRGAQVAGRRRSTARARRGRPSASEPRVGLRQTRCRARRGAAGDGVRGGAVRPARARGGIGGHAAVVRARRDRRSVVDGRMRGHGLASSSSSSRVRLASIVPKSARSVDSGRLGAPRGR